MWLFTFLCFCGCIQINHFQIMSLRATPSFPVVIAVLKSDNANGLFSFSGSCIPLFITKEDATIHCPVSRSRGDADEVTLTWNIVHQGRHDLVADMDFVNATGELVFQAGEREKVKEEWQNEMFNLLVWFRNEL